MGKQLQKAKPLSVAPGTSGKKREYGEDFKAAGQHIDNQHKLGQCAKRRIVAARSDSLQARADIV
jgi:hypothetical protein